MPTRASRLVVLVLGLLGLLAGPPAGASGGDAFLPAGALAAYGRVYHGAVRLLDGRVLVVGGYGRADGGALATAEVYDPGTGAWTPTGSLAAPRALASASLLPDGRVLVAGGSHFGTSYASTEIWDPATGAFSAGPAMSIARFAHTATRLADGRILVTGGNPTTDSPTPTASAEIYDPAANTWSATGSMIHARQTHAAVLLQDGRVLLMGGDGGAPSGYVGTRTCQLWSPATGTFALAASMADPRAQHAAVRLRDGRVLTAGGNWNATGSPITTAEIYDPALDAWSSAGTTSSGGFFPGLAALADGRALCAGGLPSGSTLTAAADVFDPETGVFASTVSMVHARMAPSATVLPDGSVLLAGGYANLTTFPYWNASCERFVPSTPNLPPTADASLDVAIHAGDDVTLDGSASHDDDTANASLVFAWTLTVRPEGSTATLAGATTATPTFTADRAGTYRATLVVMDEAGLASSPDEVVISSLNLPPTANAGPDLATAENVPVMLSGSASDPDDDPLEVRWTIVSAPLGSAPLLEDDDTLTPTFTGDLAGEYVLALVAYDGYEASAADTVTVSVLPQPVDVEEVLEDALLVVRDLPRSAFDAPGHSAAMSAQLRNILARLRDGGSVAEAAEAVQRLVERTDGFALRGAADVRGAGKDWVVTKAAQDALYPLLVLAFDLLSN